MYNLMNQRRKFLQGQQSQQKPQMQPPQQGGGGMQPGPSGGEAGMGGFGSPAQVQAEAATRRARHGGGAPLGQPAQGLGGGAPQQIPPGPAQFVPPGGGGMQGLGSGQPAPPSQPYQAPGGGISQGGVDFGASQGSGGPMRSPAVPPQGGGYGDYNNGVAQQGAGIPRGDGGGTADPNAVSYKTAGGASYGQPQQQGGPQRNGPRPRGNGMGDLNQNGGGGRSI